MIFDLFVLKSYFSALFFQGTRSPSVFRGGNRRPSGPNPFSRGPTSNSSVALACHDIGDAIRLIPLPHVMQY